MRKNSILLFLFLSVLLSQNHSLSFDGDDEVNIGDIDLVNHFTIISYVKPDYSLWSGDGGENDMIVGNGNSYMLVRIKYSEGYLKNNSVK